MNQSNIKMCLEVMFLRLESSVDVLSCDTKNKNTLPLQFSGNFRFERVFKNLENGPIEIFLKHSR